MQFEYEYDKIGNIVSEVRTEGTTVNNRSYTYDAANQLTEFKDNNYVETYTYDNVGNMLTKNINNVATSYEYNNGNQLVKEITNGQTVGYKYNVNGDLKSKTTGEEYSYDIQGNLTSIVGNGIDKQYTYNSIGYRLSETTDGEIIYYVNDINRLFEEVLQTYNNEGVINTYTYGIDRIQSVGQNNETYMYDGRGSVVGSVSDKELTSYSYTAYGELMPNSPTPNVFGYNAEATDFTTGIQYLRARYYDTTISRFFQEDDYRGDFAEPLTMHRYIYVGGNPINRIDPSGYGWVKNSISKIKKNNKKTKKIKSSGSKTLNASAGINLGFKSWNNSLMKSPLGNTSLGLKAGNKGEGVTLSNGDLKFGSASRGSLSGNSTYPHDLSIPPRYQPYQPINSNEEEQNDFICDVNPADLGLFVDSDGNLIRQPWLHLDDPAVQEKLEEYQEEKKNSIDYKGRELVESLTEKTNSERAQSVYDNMMGEMVVLFLSEEKDYEVIAFSDYEKIETEKDTNRVEDMFVNAYDFSELVAIDNAVRTAELQVYSVLTGPITGSVEMVDNIATVLEVFETGLEIADMFYEPQDALRVQTGEYSAVVTKTNNTAIGPGLSIQTTIYTTFIYGKGIVDFIDSNGDELRVYEQPVVYIVQSTRTTYNTETGSHSETTQERFYEVLDD